MERRFVLIQGAAGLALKLLLFKFGGDNTGYYVGGWAEEPVFMPVFSDGIYEQIQLYGITATGPGVNDWLVGGWGFTGTELRFLFYNHTGLIAATPMVPPWTGGSTFFATGGHFSTAFNVKLFEPFLYYKFATPTFFDDALIADQGIGFVGPQTLSEGRLDMVTNTLRRTTVVNLDYTYSVFRGNNPWDGTTYPSGNPWLVDNSSSTFARLNTNLNDAIIRSDLIGLTLYDKGVSFYGTIPWAAAGENTLTVTPWQLTPGGNAAEGTPFPAIYQAPDPNQYFAWDASLWVA
jgi:hypothetical protein